MLLLALALNTLPTVVQGLGGKEALFSLTASHSLMICVNVLISSSFEHDFF